MYSQNALAVDLLGHSIRKGLQKELTKFHHLSQANVIFAGFQGAELIFHDGKKKNIEMLGID